ncbi:MAG: 16S rRNA (guanine(527)-N(7))-methyltransferase RsmG [Rhodospirillales bacterium]|nr:16S rRNA (guanine(527)-N(7))-methyltransferase RsmG [Rhodospirillales bacterium]
MSFEDLQGAIDIDDQALESLQAYDALLHKWQKRFNLVGPKSLQDSVGRHFYDSAQLWSLIDPRDRDAVLVDLGSGAGFPGLVLSILGVTHVHLIESDANKCEFLRQAIRTTGASAIIHNERIENYDGPKADIITSRACAPLEKLLGLSDGLRINKTRMLFLKGRSWQDELTQSQTIWHIDFETHGSVTDPESVILDIGGFKNL